MPTRKRASPSRFRVGRVSIYHHHGHWWLYYRHQGQQIRRKIAATRHEAEQVAAQVNAQLSIEAPTLVAFIPVTVADLRQQFLDYHDHVMKSSVATVRRYRSATQHLQDFASRQSKPLQAHQVQPDAFAAFLRSREVSPNGHPHTVRRRLRDKGVQFILETCRAMFAFAGKRRHLPPYAGNPFATLPLQRLAIEDAKPIFVFDADSELASLKASDPWSFAIHFTLAKTGLRIGELVHLLIEDVDLTTRWLRVSNKTALGWRVKTFTERGIPLLAEVVAVLRQVIGKRKAGPVFLRRRFADGDLPPLIGDRRTLEQICDQRQCDAGQTPSRLEMLRVAQSVWRDAGAVKADTIRTSFVRTMLAIGHPEATCPKSWRHTFATLLQDANVDPLIRQLTLGHKPTSCNGLGMTATYTHTRPETQRLQIEQALRHWPKSLEFARKIAQGA